MIDYDNKAGMKLLFSFHGTVLPQLLFPVAFFSIIAAGIVYYSQNFIAIKANPAPWAIIGTALGLLMVFRTNTAYDRYWEGRKLFGALVNNSRNTILHLLGMLDLSQPDSLQLLKTVSELIVAFAETVKQRLQDEHDLEAVLDHLALLSEEETRVLQESPHLPLSLMLIIRNIVYREIVPRMISREALVPLENQLLAMVENMGGLDRIRRTPMPYAYVVHLKSLLFIFMLTLPIGIVDAIGWYTPLVVAITTFGLYGIEEIGVEIEDPFGDDPNDLPLDGICDSLHGNLNELLAEQERM